MHLLFALLIALVSCVEQEDNVYVLGQDNFDAFIAENEHVLVEFYAPWCGHCKTLAPEYAQAAATLHADTSAKIAKVDATVHGALAQKYGIQGYPTIKFFRSGSPSDYEGGRKAADLINWVTKKSGPSTVLLASQQAVNDFIAKDGVKVVAFVAEDSEEFQNFLAASKTEQFSDFACAHVFDSSLYGSNAGVVLFKTGEESLAYSGAVTVEGLSAWVLTEGFPLVEELDQPIWVRSQKTGTPLLAVFFNGDDTTTTGLVQAVAKANKGKALFSWSNRVQLLEQWGGSGKFTPSAIMIVWVGEEPKFKIWNEDDGVAFDEAGLNAFVEATLAGTYQGYKKSEAVPESNDGPVLTLVGKTFEEIVYNGPKPVFVEFYAPWCGHCKKLAPIWDELGESVKGSLDVVVAKLDATANGLPDDISVTGFPTLILFDGKKQTPYQGPRDSDSFLQFLKTHVNEAGKEDL